MNTSQHIQPSIELPSTASSIDLGRYRVCPLVRPSGDGHFTSGVSIRSGRGSATTDRVMRFRGSFASESDARHHAQTQAALWLAHRAHGLDS